MRRIGAGLALAVVLIGAGCTRHSPEHVLAIPKTMSYHRDTCARINMARTASMTVTEALAAGYHPCPLCRPAPAP